MCRVKVYGHLLEAFTSKLRDSSVGRMFTAWGNYKANGRVRE